MLWKVVAGLRQFALDEKSRNERNGGNYAVTTSTIVGGAGFVAVTVGSLVAVVG
jgi:hypothetical protein